MTLSTCMYTLFWIPPSRDWNEVRELAMQLPGTVHLRLAKQPVQRP